MKRLSHSLVERRRSHSAQPWSRCPSTPAASPSASRRRAPHSPRSPTPTRPIFTPPRRSGPRSTHPRRASHMYQPSRQGARLRQIGRGEPLEFVLPGQNLTEQPRHSYTSPLELPLTLLTSEHGEQPLHSYTSPLTSLTSDELHRTPSLSPCTLWDINGWSFYTSATGYHEPHKG